MIMKSPIGTFTFDDVSIPVPPISTEDKSWGGHRKQAMMMFEIARQPSTTLVWWRQSWIPWNLSFRYVHCTGQFTPKMKANTEPHLLSSLVWIDSGLVVSQHSSESFFHEIKCYGMTSFMELMLIFVFSKKLLHVLHLLHVFSRTHK